MTDQGKYIDPKTGCPLIDPFQQILDKIEALSVQVACFENAMTHEISIIQHDLFCGKLIEEDSHEKQS